MKLGFLTVVLTFTSTAAIALPSRQLCATRENYAAQNLSAAEGRFQVGELTKTDLDLAKLDLLNVRLACGDILRSDYCSKDNLKIMTDYVNGIENEAKDGLKTQQEVLAAKEKSAEMAATCE